MRSWGKALASNLVVCGQRAPAISDHEDRARGQTHGRVLFALMMAGRGGVGGGEVQVVAQHLKQIIILVMTK